MLETVCIVVASLLSLSVAIAGFLERISPMLAKKKAFIKFAFSSSRTARVLSCRFSGPI